MANPRQRRKARSSVGKKSVRVKDKQARLKMRAHPIMKQLWDHKLSIKENYKRFGLAIKLNKKHATHEQIIETPEERRQRVHGEKEPAAVAEDETDPEKIPLGEARILRGEDGEVKEIIYGKLELDKKPEKEDTNPVIEQIIEFEQNRPRPNFELYPSARENDWLFDLYEKYGEDYEAMVWDKKLNMMLFSAGQLKQKFRKWKKFNGIQ